MTERFGKETGSLRVTMSYYDMYAGEPEKAFNHGPCKIEHWRHGREHGERNNIPAERIELTSAEEIRDLHFMLGRMLAKLDGTP